MIKIVNVVLVFHHKDDTVLMCHRSKDPYKGLYNFVGGKKEANESGLNGAYRELEEETGITSHDVSLKPLFTTVYYQDNIELQVYFGTLKNAVTLVPEKHPLIWMPLSGTDFGDSARFAGQGNIKHMIEMVRNSRQNDGLSSLES